MMPARKMSAKGDPNRKRTWVAPTVPSLAVSSRWVALRAVWAAAAMMVKTAQSQPPSDTRRFLSVTPTRVFERQPWLFRGSLAGGEPQRVGEVPLQSDVSGLSPVSPDGSTLLAMASSGRKRPEDAQRDEQADGESGGDLADYRAVH